MAPSTHRQALNALLFLYRQVLGMELPWLQQIGRPPERKRIPVVLTVQEVQSVLSLMTGTEALGLRVKDVDFDRHAIVVRSGKGDKDRVVMLPKSLAPALHQRSCVWGRQDQTAGRSERRVSEPGLAGRINRRALPSPPPTAAWSGDQSAG